MMLIQVNFMANKVINLIGHMSAFVASSCYFKFIELTLIYRCQYWHQKL